MTEYKVREYCLNQKAFVDKFNTQTHYNHNLQQTVYRINMKFALGNQVTMTERLVKDEKPITSKIPTDLRSFICHYIITKWPYLARWKWLSPNYFSYAEVTYNRIEQTIYNVCPLPPDHGRDYYVLRRPVRLDTKVWLDSVPPSTEMVEEAESKILSSSDCAYILALNNIDRRSKPFLSYDPNNS